MQAIILAAGMGKRLKKLTNNNTKCMVKVNNKTIIERALESLDKVSLSKIIIVIGYKGEILKEYIDSLDIHTPIQYIDNPIYNRTNNIYSLALAKEEMCLEDTLLLESDIVFEHTIIEEILMDKRKNLALVDKFASWMSGTCMELDGDDNIINFIPGKILDYSEKEKYFKTVNIYKFSKEFSKEIYVPFLEAYEKVMGDNEYYETVIKLIAMLGTNQIKGKRLTGQKWYEIDDVQDLDIAESIFKDTPEQKYESYTSRYGGYWRYPELLDFCYLVNPYYPSVRLMKEMKSNFEELIMQYPSGIRINSLLAANDFGVEQEHVVVGNGAAELIKILMENIDGKMGVIRPTFEEYFNRYHDTEVYNVQSEDLKYRADDIIEYFDNKEVKNIVLINPDNPSGNYILRKDIIRLLQWAKKKEIIVILDESFVDFVDCEEEKTLIDEEIISEYNNLILIKSISKSYGVPGIRIGIMVSSNKNIISKVKKDISIWNMNSFAEFYMQIMNKYNEDYNTSLKKLATCRTELMMELRKIKYLQPYESQANYIMCKINGISSKDLCSELLKKNILVKDLSSKIKNGSEYIRIAVRTHEENMVLCKEMAKIEVHKF